jgi:hypothetical protein
MKPKLHSRHWQHSAVMLNMPPLTTRDKFGRFVPWDSPAVQYIAKACAVGNREAQAIFTHYMQAGLLTYSANTKKWAGAAHRLNAIRGRVPAW